MNCPPLIPLAVVSLLSFALGVAVGCALARHSRKGLFMVITRKVHDWFERWFPALFVLIGVAALVGLYMGVAGTIANRHQDDSQDQLLMCFDNYAAASSQSSTVVRAATEVRDEAVQVRDEAFNDLFEFILTNPPEDSPEGIRLFTALSDANRALTEAQQVLHQARTDNPVPPPPSSFCDESPNPNPTS